MNRTHITDKDQGQRIRLQPRSQESNFKPNGFWYEVDGDWRRWCEAENFGPAATPENGYYIYEVEIDPAIRLLRIRTPDQLAAFSKTYNNPDPFGLPELFIQDNAYIDWTKVSQDYDGVEIAPYQWSHRLNLMWYYSWDCASGVLWNPGQTNVTKQLTNP